MRVPRLRAWPRHCAMRTHSRKDSFRRSGCGSWTIAGRTADRAIGAAPARILVDARKDPAGSVPGAAQPHGARRRLRGHRDEPAVRAARDLLRTIGHPTHTGERPRRAVAGVLVVDP